VSTTLCRSRESYRRLACWAACLRTLDVPLPDHCWALGPDPHAPEFCNYLRRFYRLTRAVPFGTRLTVGQLVARRPMGLYLVACHDHVMVLRDGVLTDTDLGGSARRSVRWADRLTPRPAVIQ
jgi:hypothetical protein